MFEERDTKGKGRKTYNVKWVNPYDPEPRLLELRTGLATWLTTDRSETACLRQFARG